MELLLMAVTLFLCSTSHLGLLKKAEKKVDPVVTDGQLCHFPFQYNRKMHYTCIKKGKHGGQHWCALTENYDRDQLWGYCNEHIKVQDHCEKKPCRNGGTCENTLKNYHCICPAHYTGRQCQKERCFESQLLQYFGEGEQWLRFTPQTLEECHCTAKGAMCKHAHAKECTWNPCLNRGRCAEVKKLLACGCPKNYVGQFCEIDLSQLCYQENGADYRGSADVTISGTDCLPWTSDIVQNELSVQIRNHQQSLGLGRHTFCRNPDNDSQPWCYILKEHQLSWEYCSIPQCNDTQNSEQVLTTPNNDDRKLEEPMEGSSKLLEHCGKRYKKCPSVIDRIVGGLVALPASHPYIAAIYMGTTFCGGSLITSCWIVTAAHCLQHRPDVSQITVVLGQTSFNRSSADSAEFEVQEYILHERYSAFTYEHDIALVHLKTRKDGQCAEFSRFILPVCLPSTSDPISPGTRCEISGWGYPYEGAGYHSDYLQEAVVPILSQEHCKSPELHGSRLLDGMLCAGYPEGETDACQGDSGGPLVCEDGEKMVLYGVVSWGAGCARENKPGVYTNVISYNDWIKEKIR
ncbi:coagulation factor XII [Microcaecilia unicolor]|uniref:Coagulation factor XII n=1 Tax=Microcaecilia unicolor TaxID=1415580 RepID=A0A6P7YWW0_9AMPH|nr:coagulation factor XII [Microcaecilia unicolor]